MKLTSLYWPLALTIAINGQANPPFVKKLVLTPYFWAEGITAADLNKDGFSDIVYGPFIFWGGDFCSYTTYRPARASFQVKTQSDRLIPIPGYEGALGEQNAYSDCFFLFTYDFDNDGLLDILRIGVPGEPSTWYKNPGKLGALWVEYPALDVPDNESVLFVDITGDGRPELVCCSRGELGFARPDPNNPYAPWRFQAVTKGERFQRFTHGLGVGDIDGDGRLDLLTQNGWWQQPETGPSSHPWLYHPYPFAPQGAAQILVTDVNGDGLNDVISCLNPHGYGLAWFEQVRSGNTITFRRHIIADAPGLPSPTGVVFSQPHALALVDFDQDGLPDFVTGKRFWAHGPNGDVDPNAQATVYLFRLTRQNGAVSFQPILLDDDSGVGTQLEAIDINGDGMPDILCGNKKGAAVLVNQLLPRR